MKLRVAGALLSGLLCTASLLLAFQQASLALATRAFEYWKSQPSPAASLRVQQALQFAQVLPDPSAQWLDGRWKMAQDSSDPSALESFSRVAKARSFDFHPALGRARFWAANGPQDPEFVSALQDAMSQGPNETRVFAAIFPLARLHWHYLSPDLQQQLEALLVRTARREPAYAIELARDYGFAGPACRLTSDNDLALGHCRRLGIIDTEKESP